MRGQAGFWDVDERYALLSDAGDPLVKLNEVVPWEVFRKPLAKALKRSDGAKGGRPPDQQRYKRNQSPFSWREEHCLHWHWNKWQDLH